MASCLTALITLTGCATHKTNNPQPANRTEQDGYYFHTHNKTNNSDKLLVVLAFSGGGTRAAAFSYGVLEGLRNTKIVVEGRERSLLDEVDLISSVSGGSVTAAAYGLHGSRTFGMLEDAFLKRNVQRTLLLRTLNPFRWPKLWSKTYGRSEIAADFYDEILFKNATFGDLKRAGGPYLVINGTDITRGGRFDFTQHSFDLLDSDLSSYPVSYAVAASSAVPGALTPITLKNFSTQPNPNLPDWINPAMTAEAAGLSRQADRLKSFTDSTARPFIHLVDGGVSDNLGIAPVVEFLESLPYSTNRQKFLKSHRPEKVVLISVNAYSSPDKDWDTKDSPPGSISTAAAAADHTLEKNSWYMLDHMHERFDFWRKVTADQRDMKLYGVYLNFTNFRDKRDQRFFLNLPTTFVLPGANVEKLRAAGHTLLRENPVFNELLDDLKRP
jgi:NTE family protein